MSAHTPTPWVATRGAQADAFSIEGAVRTIAHVKHGPSALGDAEFIVRACNSHADLLEKLQTMVMVFNQTEPDPMFAFAAIEQALGAIAKAEGDAKCVDTHAWTWLRDEGPEQACDDCGATRDVRRVADAAKAEADA